MKIPSGTVNISELRFVNGGDGADEAFAGAARAAR